MYMSSIDHPDNIMIIDNNINKIEYKMGKNVFNVSYLITKPLRDKRHI